MVRITPDLRTSYRYVAIGFNLSYVSGDEFEPTGVALRISVVWFHFTLDIEWG